MTVRDELLDELLNGSRHLKTFPLDRMYPVVFFDALRVKIRDEGHVKNNSALCYLYTASFL
jgi:putative transposase